MSLISVINGILSGALGIIAALTQEQTNGLVFFLPSAWLLNFQSYHNSY
jgi:nucleoside permease NupC